MSAILSAESACSRVARRLAQTVGEHRYRIWFNQSARLDYHDEGKRFEVAVPNGFVADWIGKNFREQIHQAVRCELGQDVDLRVSVDPARFTPQARPVPGGLGPGSAVPGASDRAPTPRQASTEQPALRHRLEDFIVGASNELAFTAAQRLVAGQLAPHGPLFIHGSCGLGKTHLLQGVCRKMLELHPDAQVHYTTGEQFTNAFIAAVRANQIESFRRRIRRLDLLAVDDVHFIADKDKTQQEFLHSFDALDLAGAKLVMASDSHPKLIRQFSQALVSRCVRGLVVEIRPPDTALRVRILQVMAQRRGLSLLDTVVEVLAARSAGSVRELEGTLTKLHALATLTDSDPASGGGAAIGHTLLNRLYETDEATAPRRVVTVEQILQAVCQCLGLTRQQATADSRHKRVVLARWLTIHLARQLTALSFPELARELGRASHSTVIAAGQRFEALLRCGATALLPNSRRVPLTELVEQLRQRVVRG